MKKVLNLKDKKLFIVLIIAAAILILIKTFLPKEKTTPLPTAVPTPAPATITPFVFNKTGKGDPNFRINLQPTIESNFPLFNFIPFKTENWAIDYLGPLKLEVILKSDTIENRQEVLGWISSKGVDPKTHKIEWKVR